MTADTPYQWLSRVATSDPERSCLVDDANVLAYGDVLARVDARAHAIRAGIEPWEIVPVEVAIDVDSVIEILATQEAGGVPFPNTRRAPSLPVTTADDVAVCVETSGSSGSPKIVPLTFTNIAASLRSSRKRLGTGPDDRWLVCLPLSHVGGLSIIWRTLEAGGTAIVAPFDPSGAVIERLEPTIASMVPTMVHRLVDNNSAAIASIGLVLVGGAALDPFLWERCLQVGVHLVPTYGLTEAGSQVATAAPGDPDMSSGWVGTPLDDMEVLIVGLDHEPVGPGQTGLISVEGPAVFDGYLGEEYRGRRFITSDLGRLDDERNLFIEGRIDDVIVSGGENVSLGRVAEIINGLDGIDDVCAVGFADAEWGTVGGAMVVSDRDLESVIAMARSELKAHERPKRWLRRGIIPKLANGKHDLAAVRAAFEEEQWT